MDALQRRQAAARRRAQLQVIVGVGAIAALVVVAAGVLAYRQFGRQKPGEVTPLGQAASAVAGVSAEREGETWSHAELLAYLRTHGLSEVDYKAGRVRLRGELAVPGETSDGSPIQVDCDLYDTARQSHDAAGEYPMRAFAWGRFSFYASDRPERLALLARIKAALGVTI